MDPVIGIANKLHEIVKDDSKPMSEADKQNFWRIVKYIARSNSPRLYMQLGKQVVMRMSAFGLKDHSLKNLIFMLGELVDMERVTYSKYDFTSTIVQEILARKSQLSQADIIKVLEATIKMRPPATQMLLATAMQSLLNTNFKQLTQQD